MKFPSITETAQDAQRTLFRFPFVILDAALGTTAALLLIDHTGPARPTILFPIFFAALLGIPLLIAFALVAEKNKWSAKRSLVVQVVGVLLVVAYASIVPEDFTNAPGFHLFRFFTLAIGLHLFVAAGPLFQKGTVNGFWHYNMTLFLRALTALLYTFVLWAGLAIALAALDNLFGVTIPGKRYPELWILINGVFCTWFFLAGIPEDLDTLDAKDIYPKGLKIFAQYILVPLVLVYVAILYAYLGKIVVTWDWPQGWVSKLILGFSGTGIFSLLLLHPISGKTENVWIRTVTRWFYAIIIPLIFMLFLAVWRRVSQYGFTEGRYLAIASGVWLAVLVLYILLSKQKSIKFIPASLCIASFLVSVGPWGAFTVSETSQVGRLKGLLEKDSVLVEGKIQKTHSSVSFEDSKQVSSVIAYLHDMYGYDRIQPWFVESLRSDTSMDRLAKKEPAEVTKIMGIEYVARWQAGESGSMFLTADKQRVIGIAGYDRMVRGLRIFPGRTGNQYAIPEIAIQADDKLDVVALTFGDKNGTRDSLRIEVRQIVERILKDSSNSNFSKLLPETMCVTAQSGKWRVKAFLPQIYFEKEGDVVKPMWCDMDLFYSADKSK